MVKNKYNNVNKLNNI